VSDEVTLVDLSERLDGLTDLFRRRLLDDRAKVAVIEDLQGRLDRADRMASASALSPLVDSLGLVMERLKSSDPTESLVTSIVSEIEYILESVVGVSQISADPGAPVDRRRHEVISASGDGSELIVAELVRAGYEKDGVVLKPAAIVAERVSSGTGGDG
jgi:molecular chaperone GrpE (heat shock protein)